MPIRPPSLTPMNDDEALYEVDNPLELEVYMSEFEVEGRDIPSFIFQVEHQPGQFVYQWMVDILILVDKITVTEGLLNLSGFQKGSTVNVSYAYVTADSGISPYSDPTPVKLPGIHEPLKML